jgi:serine protease Do
MIQPTENQPTENQRRRRVRRVLSALLVSTALVGGGYAIRGWTAEGANPPPATAAPAIAAPTYNQAGFADLVDKVKGAVVNIATTEAVKKQQLPQMPQFPPGSPFAEMFKFFQQQQEENSGPRHALGSGFIVDPSGYIVTNNHVVDHASKIMVKLADGNEYPATVKGRDEKTDLALLKIDAKQQLPYVEFGDSDQARVGNWVIAVGNPFGLGGSVTAGIISAHDRDISDGPYGGFLQIDAPINPGNSGGPLFDQSGHVIGIDTAIYSPNGGSVGIGFAIPSNQAKTVIAQLRDHGSVARGWLGVQMQPLTPTLAKAIGRPNANGVLVDKIEPHSPAERAKLQQGDVITAFNKKPIKEPRDLAIAVADTKADTRVPMTIWRDGHERTLDVTIGTQPKERQTSSADDRSGNAPVGMALSRLTPDVRSQLGLEDNAKGVVVARVQPNSRAAESGVRPGDVIVRIGDSAVATPAEASQKIHAAEQDKKEAVPLLVMRDGTTYYLALQLAEG